MNKAWIEKIVTPLAAAFLAVLGSFAATTIANNTATNNQRAAFAEQRAQVERDKRGEAYIRFLDTTSKFARTLTAAHLCLSEERSKPVICDTQAAEVQAKFDEVANAVNLVRIYGSSTANQLMNSVLEHLPTIYATSDSDFKEVLENGLDGAEFGRTLTEFQQNMCEELPANPRPDC